MFCIKSSKEQKIFFERSICFMLWRSSRSYCFWACSILTCRYSSLN